VSRSQFKRHLNSRAWVKGCADFAGQVSPLQCRRVTQRAIAPDEFGTVAREGVIPIIHSEKRHPFRKLHVVRVTGK
jgi:hypothetical protein